jgi:hypothetical protein
MVRLTKVRVAESGLESVCGYKAQTNSVVESPDIEVITNEELLELDVDILIAAALENVITKKNFNVNMRQARPPTRSPWIVWWRRCGSAGGFEVRARCARPR